jgi:DNA polymerase (family 10)
MPKVDFGQTDDLSQVAGIGPGVLAKLNQGVYPGINYKVAKISNIKQQDYEKLPLEAYLTITHTAGRQYTKQEVEQVAKLATQKLKIRATITGSYRRNLDKLNDVDLLTTDHKHSIEEDDNIKIIRNGESQIKLLVRLKGSKIRSPYMTSKYEYVPTDILITTAEQYPFALMHFTGSKEFNQKIRAHAKSMKMKLNQYGLYTKTGPIPGLTTEKKIFAKLGMEYLLPQNRG